jgi:hypothetical protein
MAPVDEPAMPKLPHAETHTDYNSTNKIAFGMDLFPVDGN